jgi:transposase
MQISKPILTEILNLPGVDVEDYWFEAKHITLDVEVHASEAVCTRCGNLSTHLHQNHFYAVRDLSLMNRSVTLNVNRRQFKCHVCEKPFSEGLDFVDKRRRFTNRFEEQVIESLIVSDISNTAKLFEISEDEAYSILTHIGNRDINPNWHELKRLGIDEISNRKFHKEYIVVLVDLDAGKPLAFIDSRKKESIEKFLKSLPAGVLEGIEEVSMDMCRTYNSVVTELMPNAVVTVDRFHVMKQINDELDKSRREKKKEQDKLDKENILHGSKYIFLKNESDLNDEEKQKLEEIKKQFTDLGKLQEMKEEFRNIFETQKMLSDGIFKLFDWIEKAKDLYKDSVKTVIRWFGEIVGYFENGTTNGMVEGINNKLKLIKRRGYGFRNVKRFELRCLICWHFTRVSA